MIHNNWKLYAENVRDSYHATLLHTFYTTFKVNRLDMDGGMLLSEDGRHSLSYAKKGTLAPSNEYERAITGGKPTNSGRAEAYRDLNWRGQSINTVVGNVNSMIVRLHDRMVQLQARFTQGTGYQPMAMAKLFRDSENSDAIRALQAGPQ